MRKAEVLKRFLEQENKLEGRQCRFKTFSRKQPIWTINMMRRSLIFLEATKVSI